ncbi:reticulon-like protein B18 isoform X1 [Wolffia australiana]
MEVASAATTPPSRRSEPYFLRERNPQTISLFSDDDGVPSPKPIVKSHCQERLLLLSHSPARRRRTLVLVPEDNSEIAAKPRRRAKNSGEAVLAGCGSPRNSRRARRRLEKEISTRDERPAEERDAGIGIGRRKLTRNEDQIPVSLPPPQSSSPVSDSVKDAVLELVMWKNTAKSSLWFGLGTLFFSSSLLSRDFDFSFVSAVSNLGLVLLGVAFVRDSVPRRSEEVRCDFRIGEADMVRISRLVLPAANAAISVVQEIFSGDPSTTLMVAPVLLLTAKYGHWITPWRLLSAGFFLGFTVPKLYSTYAQNIHRNAAVVGNWTRERWQACRRRRALGISAALTLWNLLSAKSRITAAFICLVLLRYYRQRVADPENSLSEGEKTDSAQQNKEEEEEEEDLPEQNAGDKIERSP